jgi:hypothetical protein
MNKVVVPNSILLGEVKSLLAEGKDVVIPTKGNSMLPFIRGGRDSVNLRRLDTLEVGDIVLAEIREGVYVLHRVFAVDGDSVTLKGDGNLRNVEKCRRSDIAGTALGVLKDNGREVDCRRPEAVRRARAWRTMPVLFRRIFLAIYRRIFI